MVFGYNKALLLLTGLLTACATTQTETIHRSAITETGKTHCAFALSATSAPCLREELLAATNRKRAEHGASPLKRNRLLEKAAQSHAESMADQGYFSHQGSDGRDLPDRMVLVSYDYRQVAENLAFGTIAPEKVVENWMSSPGHRKNLLNPELREVGFGIAEGADFMKTSRRTLYWVQNLGVR